jgi:hypothetical protein
MHSLYHNALLARLNSTDLHFELVRSVLQLVCYSLNSPRQLAAFPYGHESRAQAHSDDWPQKETAGIEPDNDIGLCGMCYVDVMYQVGYEGLERVRVAKDGEDVKEGDALIR